MAITSLPPYSTWRGDFCPEFGYLDPPPLKGRLLNEPRRKRSDEIMSHTAATQERGKETNLDFSKQDRWPESLS